MSKSNLKSKSQLRGTRRFVTPVVVVAAIATTSFLSVQAQEIFGRDLSTTMTASHSDVSHSDVSQTGVLQTGVSNPLLLARELDGDPDGEAKLEGEATLENSEIFGRSLRGRPIRAHVLGDGPQVTLVFAAVHGNETATPYLVHQLRAHLKRHPGRLQGRRVVLVPVLNPDGLSARRRCNARGVDINRNYPGTWRRPRRGESFRPGASPASEPETQAMIRLTRQYRPHKIVSIHQPLHCLTYSGARSRHLVQAIARENGYPIRDNIGYPTPGGFGAYCDQIIKTPVVTLELPWQSPQAAWNRNASALLAAIALPVT